MRLRSLLISLERSEILGRLWIGLPGDAIREDTLRSLGFVHLLSATGIHLWALAAAIGLCVRAIARPLGWSVIRARRISIGVSALAWFWAWALCGFRAGMLRPVLVLGLRQAALTAGFRWRLWSPLLAAVVLELLAAARVSPEAWLGRLYYSAAVGFGLWALEIARKTEQGRDGLRGHLRAHAAMAVGSWIPIAAVELVAHGWTSVLTPVLSLVTIPLVAQVVYPLVFIGFEVLPQAQATALVAVVGPALDTAVWSLAEAVARVPTLWFVPLWACAAGAAMVCGTKILALMVLDKKLSSRVQLLAGGLACTVGVARLAWDPANQAQAVVTQLNVGQGDAALVTDSSGRAGLIDAGPFPSGREGLKLSQWLTSLASSGVTRIDWVLLTHLDADHAAGLWALEHWFSVGCVGVPEGSLSDPRIWIVATARRYSDCVPFSVAQVNHPKRPNGVMGGVAIPLGQSLYVNLGDADRRDEPRLWLGLRAQIPGWPQAYQHRILKVSHHGSRTSSDVGFLNALRPTEAWISAGRENSYGHPHPRVMERLAAGGISVRRTWTGALRIAANPVSLQTRQQDDHSSFDSNKTPERFDSLVQ